MESNKKSLLKTFSWETFHMVVIAGIIYAFTKEWEYAGFGALLYIVIETIGYYIHERLWARFGNKIN